MEKTLDQIRQGAIDNFVRMADNIESCSEELEAVRQMAYRGEDISANEHWRQKFAALHHAVLYIQLSLDDLKCSHARHHQK